jgi:DNA helicase-2/ATP-dependent DNA helicase PcrA
MDEAPKEKKVFKIRRETGYIGLKIDYVSELNQDQLSAVYSEEPRVLVLAGAGSGKTRVITYRVAFLLERGIRQEEIMLATFTNKASREMLHRVETLLEKPLIGFWGGTFHSICARLLRREAENLGYASNFTILDREDAREIISIVRSEQPKNYTEKRFPQAALLQDIFSLTKNTGKAIPEVLAWRHSYLLSDCDAIITISDEYEKRKRELNTMDYDDLMINAVRVFQQYDETRKRYALNFKHILIDEYQDTNKVQAQLIDFLASEGAHMFIVGDDSQSIYAFRGALYANILEFPDKHKDVAIKKLEINYRSTPHIIDFANEIFKDAPAHFRKTLRPVKKSGDKPYVVALRDDDEEAMFVATRILELHEDGISLGQIGVLYRAQSNVMGLEMELKKRRIPYRVRGGLRFTEQAHIKDILAHLIILANPKDEISWKRVLKMQRKIGPRRAQEIWAELSHKSDPLTAFLEAKHYGENGTGPLKDMKNLLKSLRTPEINPSEAIFRISESHYRDFLKDKYPNFPNRLGDIEELGNFAEKYKSVTEFLDEISLLGGLAAEDLIEVEEGDEAITLSTIHQAKGLEWNIVFVIHAREGNIPSVLAEREGGVDEERRIFYVAVTRAKDELYLTYPQLMRRKGSMPILKRVSPFIDEVDDSCYDEVSIEYEDVATPNKTEKIEDVGESIEAVNTLKEAVFQEEGKEDFEVEDDDEDDDFSGKQFLN